jgi:hypothetical protein
MTRGKRTQTSPLEVHLLREGIVESAHQVEATVCDNKGRLLLVAGSSETSAFIRSALKPFQALAVTTTGTLKLSVVPIKVRSNKSDRLLIFCGVRISIPLLLNVPFPKEKKVP